MAKVRAAGLGVALLLLASGLMAARGQQAGGINFAELFTQLDANGDMVIEKGEVPESGRTAFETLLKNADTDKDGKITRLEYRDAVVSLRGLVAKGKGAAAKAKGVGVGPNFLNRFRAMDVDGDGKVSKAEFTGLPEVFERGDADQDGFLTRAEVMKLLPGSGIGIPERFKELDADGDGKVSRAELPGIPLQFDRIDADQDGFITHDEATRFAAATGGGAMTPAERFKLMDRDGDGKISLAEWPAFPPGFERIDADGDGFLTLQELRAAAQAAAKKAAP